MPSYLKYTSGVDRRMLLETKNIYAGYHRKQVIYDVSLGVQKGEIVSLIGHNGAGKTTTLKTIFGLIKADSGDVIYDGKSVVGQNTIHSVRNGMCLVPQERFTFPDLTVLENLMLGGRTVKDRDSVKESEEEVYHLFPILRERLSQRAGTLSGGQQRMLSMGIALMAQPRFVMFDEPSIGLAPLIVNEIGRIIEYIASNGISVLLVEQNIKQALRLGKRVYVMKNGRIVLEESGEKLLEREEWWELF
jgi:branched-chain amino acid transport system ATP-binding protein